MRSKSVICTLTLLSLFQYTDTFCSRDYELPSFTPCPHTRHNVVNNSKYCPPKVISKHHCCKAQSVDCSIIQSSLMTAQLRSETNWCTRYVTGKEDNYYPNYSAPPSQWQESHTIDPDEFKTTSIASKCCNQPPDTGEGTTAHLNASIHCGKPVSSDTNWHTRHVSDIEDDRHEFKIIPTCQLSPITNPRTHNGQSAVTPECCNIENQWQSQRWFTSQHSYDYNLSISAKCTYLSSRVHLPL